MAELVYGASTATGTTAPQSLTSFIHGYVEERASRNEINITKKKEPANCFRLWPRLFSFALCKVLDPYKI